MSKRIFVNVERGETRAAVVEDDKLVELYVERENEQRVAGNIYKGKVENVLPGMQAAFVNIGLDKNAFLYVDDALSFRNGADEDHFESPGRRPVSIREVVQEGQEIIVQVTKEPIGTKGARVVTHLSIPGRYLVLLPSVDYVGVSRRVEDDSERDRLRALARRIKPKNMGLIVRTVAEGRGERDLAQDCRFLLRVWDRIQQKAKRAQPPALLYRDHDLVYRVIRDMFTPEVDELVIDSEEEYRKSLDLVNSLSPTLKSRVSVYREEVPLFEAMGIESEIEKALRRKVWLSCGGYVVIDQTEALMSIDVNTGKYIGSVNLADTVLRTNLEAAIEVCRQLRLRNIGGIVIVDFIDMDTREDEEKVLQRLEEEAKKDRTKVHILGFTSLGLVEITRKKVQQDLGDVLQRPCPYCGGTGQVLSEGSMAFKVIRELKKRAKMHEGEAILVRANPSVAALLIGAGGSNLARLEDELRKTIFVKGSEDMHIEEYEIITGETREEIERRALPVREGEIIQVAIQEPHVTNSRDGIARIEGYVIDVEGAGEYVGSTLQVEVTRVFRTYAKGRIVQVVDTPR